MKNPISWLHTLRQQRRAAKARCFEGQVAYLTGASSGIGLATARLLARRGVHIVLLARNEARLEAAAEKVRHEKSSTGQQVIAIAADVTDAAAIGAAVDSAVREIGPPQILINNAGISEAARFEEIPAATFDRVMQTNVYGPRHVIAAALPHMKPLGGTIVNLASAAGLMGIYGYSAYGASKFAVVGFSEALRSELKADGIHVAVVCPPEVDTPLLAVEARTIPPEAKTLKRLAGKLTAETVAEAILDGIWRRRFLIVPGRIAGFFYLLHSLSLGWITRQVSDAILALARPRR